jgi:hypothetical protein
MYEFCEIVFEKPLTLRLEERDDLLIVGRVGGGETEIDLLASGIERHALKSEGYRSVFDVREGHGVIDFEADLAVCCRDVLIQQLAHPLRINPVRRHLVAKTRRVVKP